MIGKWKISSFWDIPIRYFLIAIACVFAFDVWIMARDFKNPTFVELPEECVIGMQPRHAPCLIDLDTGHVGEMQIFDGDRQRAGELAAEQQWGVFHYGSCGPHTVMAVDKDSGWAHITVSRINERPWLYNSYKVLCEDDRKAIYELVKDNQSRWILADLYHVGEPIYYVLEPGEYDIRGYHLVVTKSELQESEYTIEMTSDLFAEEREALGHGD